MSLPPQTPLGNARSSGSSSSNAVFGAGSRSMQTPLKTPLRTPLRTPGGGEQLSHTPVINFAAIEAHKENVQPLVQGRSAHALNTALSQRQAELRTQRKQFEDLVESEENADSDDPIDAWQKYVKWIIDNYPSGQSSESDLLVTLERCTRLFKSSTQYRNDVRYLRMWILYARNVDCPSDVYNYLLANEIGTNLASLYEELALVYEGQENFEKSDETYRMGVHRSAQPIDRLKRRYAEYQSRILSKEGRGEDERMAYKDALRSAMNKAQRSMLGTKSGSTSMSANSVRGMGGDASLPSKSSALSSTNNARKPSVFKDADGEDVFAKRSKGAAEGKAGWTDIGTTASRTQEKTGSEAKAWKGEVLPQRERGATPKRPAIAIYRDSDDEDEGRTPGKAKGGDVFSKNREPSESDRLRKNPFANYEASDLKPQVKPAQAQPIREEKVKSSHKSEEKAKKKVVASSSSKPSSSKPSSSSKQERYAVSLAELYPGVDIEQAVKRTSRKHKSGELCLEELSAKRLKLYHSNDDADPWTFLDALQGQWLPEIKPPQRKQPMKRDPTVTAFTRAAQDEVLQMFNNGMVDSDEDESSEDEQSESEEEEEGGQIAQSSALKPNMIQMKENEVDPFTPTPAPKSFAVAPQKRTLLGEVPMLNTDKHSGLPSGPAKAILATPARKVFGGDRKPLAAIAQPEAQVEQAPPQKPQRVTNEVFIEEDDEDSVQEDDNEKERAGANAEEDEVDYLNRPMRELAPLSPITEATEYTRYTQSTRTSRTSTSNGRRSEAWTPFASREQGSYYENADESHYGSRSNGREEAEFSLHVPHHDEEPVDGQVSQERESSQSEIPDESTGPLCPFEAEIIDAIIERLPLSLESSDDFINLPNHTANQLTSLQKRAAQLTKRRSSSHTSPLINTKDGSAEWIMQVAENTFTVRQKLGEGGYGAVFLAEDQAGITGRQRMVGGINGDASFAVLDDDYRDEDEYEENEPKLIAIKVESPPNRWEFYILGQLRARLLDEKRLNSIICARKFFCFQDESFLMLEYAEKGTLLEIVNSAVKAGVASSSAMAAGGAIGGSNGSSASVGIDEVLVMFFIIEVIKCVEALHAVDLLHGDLKIDNCLLRLNESEDSWTHSYKRTGENGWSSKGITLIDFGRAIDLRQFPQDQQFLANWTPEKHDMPQIHKGEPWRHEIDYFGIASIAYCLLFGKYIEIVDQDENQYGIDKPLRRYWQTEIWTSLFQLCLNSTHQNDASAQLASIRDRMETWLEENCFRAGKNLKGSLKKLEIWSMKRSM